jgi:L-aminopeptidase/D-esterase-like protein
LAGIAVACLGASPGHAIDAAKTWTVCPAEDTRADCQYKGASGWQQAIDAATPGDVIRIRAGRYVGSETKSVKYDRYTMPGYVVVDGKDLDLRGEPGVQLQGSSGHPGTGIVVRKAHVTIEQVSISNLYNASDEDDVYDGHGIFTIDATVTMREVAITGVPKMGLTLRGESLVEAKGLRIVDGHIGVWLEETSQLRLENADIQDNESAGICAYASSSAQVYDSRIADNRDDGVFTDNDANVVVARSKVSGNRPFGLRATGHSVIQVRAIELAGNASEWQSLAPARIDDLDSTRASPRADQSGLEIATNPGDKVLTFDWPALRIGTAEYPAGPTGVTVFSFDRRVLGAVDVRGGGPGTVNTDYLRLGYTTPELDAVVFAGGSWYGLEATTGVASAMKDDGLRDGDWTNLALAVGAIIYDLGPRRYNEIYPDKRLAQAAYRASQTGRFPLGAQGAGRFAISGAFFGCNAFSGQGGAFRQTGQLRVAAFVVVNALGVVTDRDGRVAACYRDAGMPDPLRVTDLLAAHAKKFGAAAPDRPARNTTVSLVVTNRKLEMAELQRLAIQVHTSMGRALQPFSTESDGDVLYAVSTGELDATQSGDITPPDLGVIAGEVMWDAILSSVPPQPPLAKAAPASAKPKVSLDTLVGEYVFSDNFKVRVAKDGQSLTGRATGKRESRAFKHDGATKLAWVADADFTVPGRYPVLLRFGKDGELTVNPGHWEQVGWKR